MFLQHRQKVVGGHFSLAKGGTAAKQEDYVDKIEKLARQGQMAVSDALGMGDAVRYANELSEQQYPGENLNKRGDALRHLLWQGALQQQYGDLPASAVGWAHELGDASPAEKEMDTFNNELGRQLGSETANKDELLQRAVEMINQGKAKTIE